jgi:hypothetical protein
MRSGSPDRRKIGFVDLFEVGVAQRAVARQRLVNDPAEGYFFITMLPTSPLWTSKKPLIHRYNQKPLSITSITITTSAYTNSGEKAGKDS